MSELYILKEYLNYISVNCVLLNIAFHDVVPGFCFCFCFFFLSACEPSGEKGMELQAKIEIWRFLAWGSEISGV